MTLSRDYWDDSVYDTRPSFLDGLSVDPSERYGAPVRHSKSQMAFRFVCAVVLAGAWTAFVTSGELVRFAPVAQSAIATVLDKASELAARLDRSKAPDFANAHATAGASSPQANERALPEIPIVQVAAPEPAEVKGADYAENAPPPVEDPAIAPQKKKAAAAGLGSDLPNVLLSRLSKVDFQNAAYAIKTALAKTRGRREVFLAAVAISGSSIVRGALRHRCAVRMPALRGDRHERSMVLQHVRRREVRSRSGGRQLTASCLAPEVTERDQACAGHQHEHCDQCENLSREMADDGSGRAARLAGDGGFACDLVVFFLESRRGFGRTLAARDLPSAIECRAG
jgi:hypothetical protein